MKRLLIFTILLAVLSPSILVASGNGEKTNKADSVAFIICASERGKVLLLNSREEIIREIEAKNTYDAHQLKGGNILYTCHYGVQIITPADEIAFDYQSESEIFACQAIEKNRILIGECSAGRLLEVDRKGKILKVIPLTYKVGGHICFRSARKLENGNYMVSQYGDKTVREYNSDGEIIQEFVRPNNVYGAHRLENGNTVIADKFALSIYDKNGNLIWEFNAKEYPELGVNHLAGFQYLPNNEIVVCNWLGHKPFKKGVPLFKINLDKKVIWTYNNAAQTCSCTNIQVYPDQIKK
ncbi:hypothetical protein [Mangrovibacterium sp.]|uniref:beta-propeller domain-containing protein n=1 Tax=Mangrovibacterium sp. TaxID=1961364 RepID=UPI0035659081